MFTFTELLNIMAGYSLTVDNNTATIQTLENFIKLSERIEKDYLTGKLTLKQQDALNAVYNSILSDLKIIIELNNNQF